MTTWTKMNLVNASSPTMEQLIMFHDHTMIIIIMITSVVMMMMKSTIMNKFSNRMLLENQTTETLWTIIPAILLIMIALPSLNILYMMEEMNNPFITLKAIGHQWYWTYEYSDKKKNIEFESFMKKNKKNLIRLIETDSRIILPTMTQTRIIVSSSDVIHSWTIPSMGLKMDAVPGRLNQMSLMIKKAGVFSGQCSEICGANHSFMPIMLEGVQMKNFIKWFNK